ncbi:FecR domain-containing protein [Shimia sp. SDUM112013]|uniref:FecR domain-containing protein n=1 Tax=Shimia sp. SDUM112013 TaxID=3136160 RepID=UPI0032ED9002
MLRPRKSVNLLRAALWSACLAIPIMIGGLAISAPSQDSPLNAPYEPITFSGEETLRDFVARHLNDPDLWPTVLRINQVPSPADLTPGMIVQMPVQQVAFADNALLASLTAIQKATAEGARLFAPEQIGAAFENRETAIFHRGEGAWQEVVVHAEVATEHANEAFDISVQQRDRSAEALITDIHGNVEGRDPTEAAWSDRALRDILVEFERVRTLSNSTTQVTFRDLSRLRLNPNSNATIQRMRSDPLTGKEVTKVSLASGDFYALLNQLSDQDSFEIDVPGIKTTTESNDFWIKNDDQNARFVNYDAAALDIQAGTQNVSLGRDEGVVITPDGQALKTEALDRPTLTAPLGNAKVFGSNVPLGWRPHDGAAGYWLELASDRGFNQMVVSEWGISGTAFRAENLAPGAYFWRVAALDKLGLPGKWSETGAFELRIDTTPPFLALFAPPDAITVETPEIEVLGASEKDALLQLNGQDVTIGVDGSFIVPLTLQPGTNTLLLEAVDAAGNTSTKTQTITYRPGETATITLDAGLPRDGDILVTRNAELTVLARTSADDGRSVVVTDMQGTEVVRTEVVDGGQIGFLIAAVETIQSYDLAILSDSGKELGRGTFAVQRDQTPPVVALDAPPPRSSFKETLDLAGTVTGAVSLEVDGRDEALSDGRFTLSLPLAPGRNRFALRALDAAGNVGLLAVETVLDLDPPEIVSVSLDRPEGDTGPIEISVEARDISGLRQAAQFIVMVGDAEREGYLRCDSAAGLCRATLPAEPGEVELVEVILQDYAGNEAIW